MDFSRFNQAEQAQITAMIEHKQMKDFMRLYSNLVQRCFDDCATDFTTKSLTGKEVNNENRVSIDKLVLIEGIGHMHQQVC
ncbi:hypothetical protein BDB01DRAFT_771224 [Pilobolus umbonatus]|nr:hypothetical protein BDB01DRAFT_771224 [Pilobolus umbonatus]